MYCEFCIYIFSIYFCDRWTWNFPTGSQAYFYLILWFYRKGNSKFYNSQIKILFVSASIFFLLLKICIRFDYSAITLKYQNFFKLRSIFFFLSDKKNISNYFEYEYLFFFFLLLSNYTCVFGDHRPAIEEGAVRCTSLSLSKE